MESLPNKFRSKCFAEIVGQPTIVSILSRQIQTNTFRQAYLFAGPPGTGKTSIARIMASTLNNNEGEPYEIDAASNNGVDSIRQLIVEAQQTSIDSKYKIFILDECVSGDTEILTEYGWKRFDSLDKTEKVAQYNNGKIEFVKPFEYICRDYIGDMYKVSIGNKAEFIMSPNHVQPLLYTKSGLIREKYIKDTKFCQSNKLLRAGMGIGKIMELSALDRLAIALQADGTLQCCYDTYNYWVIQVNKTRKKERLLKLLIESGLPYKQIKCNKLNAVRYSVKTPKSITKILSTHFKLFDMSYMYASDFIEELMCWDGHLAYNKYYDYCSIIKENVDFCQSVGILGGFSSRTSIEIDNRKDTHNDVYRLYLTKTMTNNSNEYVKKESFNFNGKIYCVKVPSHMIIIRRNGYEMVTGNCHMLSNQAWNAALKLIEEPPLNSIFIFCTTNPEKIPTTIMTRVQRFDFKRVSIKDIADRLEYICNEELVTDYDKNALYKIASMSNGFVREAISLLEKCLGYSNVISLANVETVLGCVKFETLLDLTNNIISKNESQVIQIINELKNSNSSELKVVDELLEFLIECAKYQKTNDIYVTKLLPDYKDKLKFDCDLTSIVDRVFKFRCLYNSINESTMLDIIALDLCRR